MKSKIIAICIAPFLLAACNGDDERPALVKTEYKVVEIDEKYYECEKVPLPDPETLDDERLARLINDLVKANRVCANNMQAIKTYTEAAKKILEERSE